MNKILSAKQKAQELGITTSGLAKTRHLYKHIKKSPRKYLYFEEDPREVVRPNMINAPVTPANSRTLRRRNVSPEDTNYHKAPGGSGNSLKMLNQMRAKASLEGKHSDEELNSMNEAMAIKIEDNHKEIVEKKQFELQTKITVENERLRKADPSYYVRWLRGPTASVTPHKSPWTPLYPKEPDEYERYSKEHLKDEKKFEYY